MEILHQQPEPGAFGVFTPIMGDFVLHQVVSKVMETSTKYKLQCVI